MVLSEILSFYGAILSTILALFKLLEYLRDRVKIKVTVTYNQKIVPISKPDSIDGDTFDKSPSLIVIKAVNIGRRPVTIKIAGLMLPSGRGEKNESLISYQSLNDVVDLTENKSHSFALYENDVQNHDLNPDKYIGYVIDAAGKCYYSHNALSRLWKLSRLS
jgi:hypothetical protein